MAELDDLSLLASVATRLDGALEDEEAIDAVLSCLEAERGIRRLGLFLLDRGQAQLLLDRAPSAPRLARRRLHVEVGAGLLGTAAAEGRPRLVEAPDPEDPLRAFVGEEARPLAAVPIKYGPDVVGALACGLDHGETRRSAEQLAILEVAARMLGPSIAARQTRLSTGGPAVESAGILGRSKSVRDLMAAIATVAPSDTTVLVLGESGTGKEMVADAIHRASHRADGPFVRVNCAALPEGVIESELFGHERGAFTGAVRRRIGRFEAAHEGTIFLDEVGDLPAATQVALLRTLQERTIHRVGGNAEIPVDVRVVAATHRDLSSLRASGEFREDLYYRLDVFPIRTPALRDRRTDIPLLADHFVEKYARAARKSVRRISSRAIDLLMAYHWPGNVRELENCMERAVLLAQDHVVHARHLPPTLQLDPGDSRPAGSLEGTLEAIERDLLDDALKVARGNMAEAARQLGLTERKMGLRVRRHGLDPKRYRFKR